MSGGRAICVLALSPIPEEGAGCRFRIAQFIPYLESVGINVTLELPVHAGVLSPGVQTRALSAEGGDVRRAVGQTARFVARFVAIRPHPDLSGNVSNRSGLLRAAARRAATPSIVFDFDDAISLRSVSDANQLIAALKQPGKVASIIRHSDHVIAGNEYLADYARRFNPTVTMIPTCVDTDRFVPAVEAVQPDTAVPARELVVGWIGSPTTALYIRGLASVLRRVRERHPFVLRVSGTGDPLTIPGVDVDNRPWSLQGEVELFNTCDVGVYPLADDEWSKGKCGFKAIQFMACGVPVVAAAVGVNRTIVQDGTNGFLASTEDEWVEKLSRLLSDAALRRRLAVAGRRTVEEGYSLRVNAPTLAATLRAVVERSRAARTGRAIEADVRP